METWSTNDFGRYLEARGLAPRTVVLYVRAVILICKSKDGPVSFVMHSRLSSSRRETYKKALLHWAGFLGWEAEVKAEIQALEIIGRGQRSRPVRALTLDEWARLREAIRSVPNEAERAVLTILATSGLRVAEVLRLTRAQLHEARDHGQVSAVRLKGGHTGPWLLGSEEQKDAVLRLLDDSREEVWQTVGECRCSESAARRLRATLERLGKDLDLPIRVSPHVLRRAVADAVRVAGGGDMKLVQEVLHHKSLSTTLESYQDHGHPEEVKAVMRKALTRGWSDEA